MFLDHFTSTFLDLEEEHQVGRVENERRLSRNKKIFRDLSIAQAFSSRRNIIVLFGNGRIWETS
jgi:hypothetical protein